MNWGVGSRKAKNIVDIMGNYKEKRMSFGGRLEKRLLRKEEARMCLNFKICVIGKLEVAL